MPNKTKKIQLSKAFTWKGANYAPGSVEMPEAAAAYAVKRGFGKSGGGSAAVAKAGDDFKPLSLEDTMKRFQEMDFADEVMRSMQFHEAAIKEKFGNANALAGGGNEGGARQETVAGQSRPRAVEGGQAGWLGPGQLPWQHGRSGTLAGRPER